MSGIYPTLLAADGMVSKVAASTGARTHTHTFARDMSTDTTKKQPGRVRVQNRQALIDTLVYLCPNHYGGTGIDSCCEEWDGTRTNCTGRGTYSGGCTCSYITNFFKTYTKFVNKEMSFI